jgi:hypothetical protein
MLELIQSSFPRVTNGEKRYRQEQMPSTNGTAKNSPWNDSCSSP